MEERNLVHDTRLFISHDAPQQGANVPLSLQYLYRHAGNLQMDIPVIGVVDTYLSLFGERTTASYLTLLDEPATTQLLNNRFTTTYSLDNNPHDTFYNNLRTKGLPGSGGYPTLTRNVAISNGSECGNLQNFAPGSDLLNIDITENLSYLENILASLLTRKSLFTAITSSGGKFNIDFVAKSLYTSSGNEIYSGTISYTRNIIFGLGTKTNNITNKQVN
ncbi:hypothetical protein N9V96_04170 [Polaribacter sp.]|nr:hypothetical protein [Polaribacter sp.]